MAADQHPSHCICPSIGSEGPDPDCPAHGQHDSAEDLRRINEAAARIDPSIDVLAEITKGERR